MTLEAIPATEAMLLITPLPFNAVMFELAPATVLTLVIALATVSILFPDEVSMLALLLC